VSAARADIGAQESRFNFSADSISTQTQNLQSANSAIKDVDIAAEQAKLSSAEVKTQAAVSAEAAANQMPQYLLKLLG
jgi:flagellin